MSPRRERRGWYFYDWANSAFNTSVTTVFLGPYLAEIADAAADAAGFVFPFGVRVRSGSFFPYVVSLSVLVQVVFLPVVGAIVDRSSHKRRLLGLFAFVGSVATMCLYFVADERYLLGGASFVIANVAFGCSIVVHALVNRPPLVPPTDEGNALSAGFRQLRRTAREARSFPETLRFLFAYLLYNDGIQTVIALAAVFGAEELAMEQDTLVLAILLVQFVAIAGALLLGRLATGFGAKRVVLASLMLWTVVVAAGYFLPAGDAVGFFVLSAAIGLVLGGSQSLSRSLFARMIPPGREAEYFSFYEISERGTSWLGPLLFGLALQVTDSYRIAILSLIAFFVAGGLLLARVDVRRAVVEAGNQPTGA